MYEETTKVDSRKLAEARVIRDRIANTSVPRSPTRTLQQAIERVGELNSRLGQVRSVAELHAGRIVGELPNGLGEGDLPAEPYNGQVGALHAALDYAFDMVERIGRQLSRFDEV